MRPHATTAAADTSASAVDSPLLDALTRVAIEAGEAILAIRRGEIGQRAKADGSPVTAADEAAQEIILRHLAALLPGVPVVSEEQATQPPPSALRETFVLVDPLDGTREFVEGRDEFTVNVALIASGAPQAGVVSAPALGQLWRGRTGHGAERLDIGAGGAGPVYAIHARPWQAAAPVALVSRSHIDAHSLALLARLHNVAHSACGSSLKFCRLAEGAADLYPRLAPTMEWDIAAGHAVLAAAGGCVRTPAGGELRYGTNNSLKIPGFIAWGDPQAAQERLPAPSR